MKISKTENKGYFQFPKEYFEMLRGGELSLSQFLLLILLRDLSNIKGVAAIESYSWLGQQLPRGTKLKGHAVRNALSALKHHKLINYSNSQGSRSGFRITLAHWPIGHNMARIFIDDNAADEITSESMENYGNESLVDTEVTLKNHKFQSVKNTDAATHFEKLLATNITSGQKEKKNITIDTSTIKKTDCISVSGFNPSTGQQAMLKRLAELCEELCMNYLLGKYSQHGQHLIGVIGRCEMLYKEANLNEIDNKPAFMCSLIEKELISIDLGNNS